jgi:hypothetical protein
MMEPTRRTPPPLPGWNDRIAVALLVVAGHPRAVEPGPLTPAWRLSSPAGTSPPSSPCWTIAPAPRCATVPTSCAACSARARPRSTSASSPASASPSVIPSFASTSPAPPPAPVSTSSRRPAESARRPSVSGDHPGSTRPITRGHKAASLTPHTRCWRSPTVGPARRFRGPIVVPSRDHTPVFVGPRVVPGPRSWSHVSYRKRGLWSHALP